MSHKTQRSYNLCFLFTFFLNAALYNTTAFDKIEARAYVVALVRRPVKRRVKAIW